MRGSAATGDELLRFLRADRVVRTGVAIVVLFFVGFVGWATLAPLESAIIAGGVIVDTAHESGGVSIAMRVPPEDADDVRPGMTAKVEFSADKLRRFPMLTGLVTFVSPRALEDPRSGQGYFLARLSLARTSISDSPRMLPGMPVRVEIPTGAHTALEYLVEPIRDVMHNGMREK